MATSKKKTKAELVKDTFQKTASDITKSNQGKKVDIGNAREFLSDLVERDSDYLLSTNGKWKGGPLHDLRELSFKKYEEKKDAQSKKK